MAPADFYVRAGESGPFHLIDEDEVPPDVRAALRAPARVVHPKQQKVDGVGSWWMSKSREELSSEAAARADTMSNTREGRLVKSSPLP